jgi:hypothetical protein
MTPDNLLLYGIVLIVASAALGLVAYAFVLNRREADESADRDTEAGGEQGTEGVDESRPSRPAEIPAASPRPFAQAPSESAPPFPTEPSAAAAPPLPTRPGATLLIAMLQDDSTGRVFMRIGDKEYRRPGDLRDPKDREAVERVIAELGSMAGRAKEAEPAKPIGTFAEPVSRPVSMVEQINQIVERKLEGVSGIYRAVRLVEVPGGSAAVYVGVDRFDSVEDVPDPEIRRIIRDAVTEWEARS